MVRTTGRVKLKSAACFYVRLQAFSKRTVYKVVILAVLPKVNVHIKLAVSG